LNLSTLKTKNSHKSTLFFNQEEKPCDDSSNFCSFLNSVKKFDSFGLTKNSYVYVIPRKELTRIQKTLIQIRSVVIEN